LFYVLQDAAILLLVCASLFDRSVVLLADLANQGEESFLDVDSSLRGGFQEGAIERLGQILAFGLGDLSFGLEIALVATDDEGHLVGVLDSEDLLAEGRNFVEGGARGDGIHAEETLSSPHVLVSHGAVFFLSSGIEDVEEAGLVVDGDLLSVGVLDGGIVLVNEMVLDELNGEGRLPDSSSSDNHEFVFSCHVLLKICWLLLVVFKNVRKCSVLFFGGGIPVVWIVVCLEEEWREEECERARSAKGGQS